MNNKKAIEIIEKYKKELKYFENSEGWYKYTTVVKELIDKNIATEEEIKILSSYKEKEIRS